MSGAPLGVAHEAGRAGEALAHAHALLLVQEEGVGLDGQVMLQGHLGLDQNVQGGLGFHQPVLELVDGVLDLPHLAHQPTRAGGDGQLWEITLKKLSSGRKRGREMT